MLCGPRKIVENLKKRANGAIRRVVERKTEFFLICRRLSKERDLEKYRRMKEVVKNMLKN